MVWGIAFWNVNGVRTNTAKDRKDAVGDSLVKIAADHGIKLFCLSEVGDETILGELGGRLGKSWTYLLGAPLPTFSNLAVLYDGSSLKITDLKPPFNPLYGGDGKQIVPGRRPAAFFTFESVVAKRSFLLVPVHLKAEKLGHEEHIRRNLAVWIRPVLEHWRQDASKPRGIIVGGDFNAEPGEGSFRKEALRAHRRGDECLRSKDSVKLYNPTWRLAVDRDPVDRQPVSKDGKTSFDLSDGHSLWRPRAQPDRRTRSFRRVVERSRSKAARIDFGDCSGARFVVGSRSKRGARRAKIERWKTHRVGPSSRCRRIGDEMIVPGSIDQTVADRMRRALAEPPRDDFSEAAKRIASILSGAQEGLRGSGDVDAVLELQVGVQTQMGQRYVAILRNDANVFEQPLFSVFEKPSGRKPFAFQAGGDLETGMTIDEFANRTESYLRSPQVTTNVVGLLRQFRKR